MEAENKKIQLVFHGTPEINVPAICASGLDPKLRERQLYGPGDYFGATADVSLGYCRGGTKMVLFVVLLDGVAFAETRNVLFVNSELVSTADRRRNILETIHAISLAPFWVAPGV